MSRFSVLGALTWSATWAVGVAIGVAAGAYLTLLGSAAAPGAVRLDRTELIVLPAMAAAVVFMLSFAARLVIAVIRRSSRDRDAR